MYLFIFIYTYLYLYIHILLIYIYICIWHCRKSCLLNNFNSKVIKTSTHSRIIYDL